MPNKTKTNLDRRAVVKIVILSILALAIVGYLIWDVVAKGPLTSFLLNRDQLISAVESWGVFAPLLYIIIQVAQIVVAPIPGQIVGGIGGFLFGAWGILWTTIGTLLGSYIVYRLARRFGRPLLEKFFKKSSIERFDFILSSRRTALILIIIFVLPGFPDDMICYLAGLTKLSMRQLMTITFIGRTPLIIATNFLGSDLTTNFGLVLAIAVIMIILFAIAVMQHGRIMKFLQADLVAEPEKTVSDQPKKSSKKEK